MLASGGGTAVDQATGLRINRGYTSLNEVLQQDGLTRTEAREDGTFGLTAVVSIDLLEAQSAQAIDTSEVVLAQADTTAQKPTPLDAMAYVASLRGRFTMKLTEIGRAHV